MKVVQPIRSPETRQEMYEIARAHDRIRKNGDTSWELLLLIGFNTSLRISDLRKLRVKDIRDEEKLEIIAEKTGKTLSLATSEMFRKKAKKLLKNRNADDFLFASRETDPETGKRRAITRQQAYNIIREICARAGVPERVGCHTLRKTYGYVHYQKFRDIAALQRVLCHTSQRDTLVYIGISADEQDAQTSQICI